MKELLRGICLFESLNNEQLQELENICSIKKLNPGNILFYEGEEPKYLYFLIEGLIKLYRYTPNNQINIINYFHTPTLIGESAMLEKTPYQTNAECEINTTILIISFEKFEKFFLKNPQIALAIIMQLVAKVKKLMNTTMQHSSTQKVAQLICENPELFEKLKKYKIAEILNMTPETLSRTLKQFQKEGFINYTTKSLEILDSLKLKEIFSTCSIDN
jgi:CRP/FNR family transcriptional regulator, dissimilatory nitrate respiration regulator